MRLTWVWNVLNIFKFWIWIASNLSCCTGISMRHLTFFYIHTDIHSRAGCLNLYFSPEFFTFRLTERLFHFCLQYQFGYQAQNTSSVRNFNFTLTLRVLLAVRVGTEVHFGTWWKRLSVRQISLQTSLSRKESDRHSS